jgi:hypothetical protein
MVIYDPIEPAGRYRRVVVQARHRPSRPPCGDVGRAAKYRVSERGSAGGEVWVGLPVLHALMKRGVDEVCRSRSNETQSEAKHDRRSRWVLTVLADSPRLACGHRKRPLLRIWTATSPRKQPARCDRITVCAGLASRGDGVDQDVAGMVMSTSCGVPVTPRNCIVRSPFELVVCATTALFTTRATSVLPSARVILTVRFPLATKPMTH